MIGLTPGAASSAIDSLRMLELAADPKKLRKALEDLQGEQEKVQAQIEALRIKTKEAQDASIEAEAMMAQANAAQDHASQTIAKMEDMQRQTVQGELKLKGDREQLQRDIAEFEQVKIANANQLANAIRAADEAKAAAQAAQDRANIAAEKASAREAAAASKERDLEDRAQALRKILADPLKG